MKTEIIFEISEYSTDAHLRAATKSDNPLVRESAHEEIDRRRA
jgi:hypothetical protein